MNSDLVFHNTGSAQLRVGAHRARGFSSLLQVMTLLSVFTPALAAVLCLVAGFILMRSRETKIASPGRSEKAPKADHRPWVDQDLQDDTETPMKENGRRKVETFIEFVCYF